LPCVSEIHQEFFGIDPWTAAIERTKFKLKTCNIRNVEITCGVAEELPYEDNFFDLIVSNNGINNVEDINKTFSECYRVTKKDAQFVFTMNLETTMIEFYNVYEEVLIKNDMMAQIEIMKGHILSKRKSLQEIEEMIIKSGYEINRIIHDKFYLRYADGTAMLNHFLIKIGFLEEWLKIIPHNKVEIIFDEIEKKLNKVADEIGEIKLSVPFVTIDCRK
jgi:ubiquinone/menaquinone biosynthesis C-methylase UbiE